MTMLYKIFIHGLESSGKGFKGRFLKKIFPDIVCPDFLGSLEDRLEKLYKILENKSNIIIIGSSFGGLMATIYAIKYPEKVSKLILLAPALSFYKEFFKDKSSITVETIIYHGCNDTVVPIEDTKNIACKLFRNLSFNIENDDHLLHNTMNFINWRKICG